MVLLNLATPRFVCRFLEATGTLQAWMAQGYLEPDRLLHDRALWAQHKHELSALLRTRTAEEWDALATQVLLPLTRIRTSAAWIGSQHAQAIIGMQARMGGGADQPAGQPFAINDYCTGLLGAFSLGPGLFHLLRTGEGQHVKTSLGHAATFLQMPYMQTYAGKV